MEHSKIANIIGCMDTALFIESWSIRPPSKYKYFAVNQSKIGVILVAARAVMHTNAIQVCARAYAICLFFYCWSFRTFKRIWFYCYCFYFFVHSVHAQNSDTQPRLVAKSDRTLQNKSIFNGIFSLYESKKSICKHEKRHPKIHKLFRQRLALSLVSVTALSK